MKVAIFEAVAIRMVLLRWPVVTMQTGEINGVLVSNVVAGDLWLLGLLKPVALWF